MFSTAYQYLPFRIRLTGGFLLELTCNTPHRLGIADLRHQSEEWFARSLNTRNPCQVLWIGRRKLGQVANPKIALMTVPGGTDDGGAGPGSGDERQLLDFRVFEPAWSPDGPRIAFGFDHEGFRAIYVMDANGSNVQKLSNTRAGENCRTWSPDGTRIAFASWRDGDGEIHVVAADGGNLQKLTDNWFEDEFPAWLRRHRSGQRHLL